MGSWRHSRFRDARARCGRRPRGGRRVHRGAAARPGAADHDRRTDPGRRRHRVSPGDRRARRSARAHRKRPRRASTSVCAARTCEAGGIVIEAGTVLRPQELGLDHLARHLASQRAPPPARRAALPPATRSPSRARRASPARSTTPTGSPCAARSSSAAARSSTCGIVPDRPRRRCARSCWRPPPWPTSCVTSGGVSVGAYDLVKDVLGRDRYDRFLAGGDAARTPARRRPHRLDARSSACPATRSPRCWPSCSSCGPRSTSSPGPATRLSFDVARAARSRCARSPGRREFKRGILTYRRRRVGGSHRPGPQGSGILSSMVAGNCLDRARGGSRRRRRRASLVLVEPFIEPL